MTLKAPLFILHSLAHIGSPSHSLPLEQTQWDWRIQPGTTANWLCYYSSCHRGAGALLSPAGALWSQWMDSYQWSLGVSLKGGIKLNDTISWSPSLGLYLPLIIFFKKASFSKWYSLGRMNESGEICGLITSFWNDDWDDVSPATGEKLQGWMQRGLCEFWMFDCILAQKQLHTSQMRQSNKSAWSNQFMTSGV